MSFLSNLFGSKGKLLGRFNLLNRPSGVEYMIVVDAIPVEAGAPPPYPGEPPEEVRSEKRMVGCGLGKLEFELVLPVGHYQLCAQLIPAVINNGRAELDPSQEFVTWPLPRAVSVEKDGTQRVMLKVDLNSAGHKGWEQGEARSTKEELGRGVANGWNMPVFGRLPPRLREQFSQAIQLQQAQRHAEAVTALDALLGQLRSGSSNDLKELALIAMTTKSKSLLALERAEEAMLALRDIPKGMEVSDPSAFIDYMYTQIDCLGHLGELGNLAQALTKAISLCLKAQAMEPLEKTIRLALYWTGSKGGPEQVLLLARGLRGSDLLQQIPLMGLVVDDYCWEALDALGRGQEALQMARNALKTLAAMEVPPEAQVVKTWRERMRNSLSA